MINSGRTKLDKYYRLSDKTPVYVATLVLNPIFKWSFVHKTRAKARMLKFCNDCHSPVENAIPIPSIEPTDTNNPLRDWFAEVEAVPLFGDEYSRHCSTPQVQRTYKNSWEWWLEPQQQSDYPNLGRIALDILSVPAMSAEPERLFSVSKMHITDRRNKLEVEFIERLMCLKSWMRPEVWKKDF